MSERTKKRGCDLWGPGTQEGGWTWAGARSRDPRRSERVELRVFDTRHQGALVVGSTVAIDKDLPDLPPSAFPRRYSVAWVGNAASKPAHGPEAVETTMHGGTTSVLWSGMTRREASALLRDTFGVEFDPGFTN